MGAGSLNNRTANSTLSVSEWTNNIGKSCCTCSETPGNGELWSLSLRSIVVLSGFMLNSVQNTWQSSIHAERAKKFNILCRIQQLVVDCKVQDVSRDLGGRGEITGLDMKTGRIPVVEMQLCSCVRSPPIVRSCLKQATCIMWIILDVCRLAASKYRLLVKAHRATIDALICWSDNWIQFPFKAYTYQTLRIRFKAKRSSVR